MTSTDSSIEAAAAAELAAAPIPVSSGIMRVIDRAAETLVVVALVGELAMVLANILARVFFQTSFLWSDEVAKLSLSILAFIGGAVAYRRREHAFVRLVIGIFPGRGERAFLALSDNVVLFVAGLTCVAVDPPE
jgi:TRAP-type C4-dicarboxylate transport system permease small subunit